MLPKIKKLIVKQPTSFLKKTPKSLLKTSFTRLLVSKNHRFSLKATFKRFLKRATRTLPIIKM